MSKAKKTYSVFSIRIPKSLHEALKSEAKKQSRATNNLINIILADSVTNRRLSK